MKLIEIAACRVGIDATCCTFGEVAAAAGDGGTPAHPRAIAASPAAKRTDTRRVIQGPNAGCTSILRSSGRRRVGGHRVSGASSALFPAQGEVFWAEYR